MNLSFSTVINGKKNFFIEKIWACIIANKLIIAAEHAYHASKSEYQTKFGIVWDGALQQTPPQKRHTIRHKWQKKDKSGVSDRQWKAGNLIHPVINNRAPGMFTFAPPFPVKSIQRIDMNRRFGAASFEVVIEGKIFAQLHYGNDEDLNIDGLQQLAINDGFESVEDFVEYFTAGIEDGVLIHWTDLKY